MEFIKVPTYANKKKKYELTLHSGIAHMTYRLEANAVKSWFFLIDHVFDYINISTPQEFAVPVDALCNYLDMKTRNYNYLETMLSSIRATGIRFNVLGKIKDEPNWKESSLFGTVGIENGNIVFEIPTFLKQKLLEYKKMFVVINLKLLKDFKHKHSLALYIILTDYLIKDFHQTEKIFTIQELRDIFSLEDNQYQEYKEFNKFVLKRAINEINDKSSLHISYKSHKTVKRKIVSIKFTFKVIKQLERIINTDLNQQITIDNLDIAKNDNEPNTEVSKIFPTDEKVIEYLKKYKIIIDTKVHQERLKKIIERIGIDNLNNYLSYLIEITKSKSSDIIEDSNGNKNIGGFFIGCLRSEDYLNSFYLEIDKKLKKEQDLQIKIDSIIQNKLQNLHYDYNKKKFMDLITNNYSKYEQIFLSTVNDIVKENPFFYDYSIMKRNNGQIDKNLLKDTTINAKIFSDYSNRFSFEPVDYETWKNIFQKKDNYTDLIQKITLESKKEALNLK